MFQRKATAFKNPAATLGLLTLVATALLLLPLPVDSAGSRWPALFDELENLCHPLMFALLAHAAFRLLRLRMPASAHAPYSAVLILAIGFGLATEAVQALVGRDSSWIDLRNDVLGAGSVLLLRAWREYRSLLAGLGAVATALLATAPFLWTTWAYAFRATQAPVLWQPDSVLFQRFSHWQSGAYPGLVIDEPPPDWSGYRVLTVALRNLGNVPSPVTVRVHDGPHNQSYRDRYNRRFVLPGSGTQVLRIPLEEIRLAPRGRQMDMTAIRGVVVFQTTADEPLRFRVDSVRLER